MDEKYYASGMPLDEREDHLVRAVALNGNVKAVAIKTTAAVEKARELHNTTNAATAALGRFMTGSLLIAESLKNDTDTQTTIIRADGPIKGMTCVCDSKGHARAYPYEGNVETTYLRPGKINVGEAVGKNGSLTVIRDVGLKEPYSGSVELISGEIAEDFTYYLASSEQTPSVVALGVQIKDGHVINAGGMMIQMMPGYTEEDLDYVEKRANGGFPEITFLMEEGFSPAKILDLFMGDPQITYLNGYPVGFECPCSKERMSDGLATIGRAELYKMIKDNKDIETVCHFCGTKYTFTPSELEKIFVDIMGKD
ncbi:MAG: Hsp33 family molecular chaperone HslO [Clostridiales bacterium]|nr:Hsp33 family molecular chaperone HslO [Clostridiales bacterium]